MQNRFTPKDFLYVLIGLVIILLLFLNMFKTNREATALDGVQNAMKAQQTTLSSLDDSLKTLGNGLSSLQNTVRKLDNSISQGTGLTIDPALLAQLSGGTTSGGTATPDLAPVNPPADGAFRANAASPPDYLPAADIRFSAPSDSVNRQGLTQQWQTTADQNLPQDFGPGDQLVNVWRSEPGTLTPYVSRDAYATRIYYDLLEPLAWTDLDPPYANVPGLAKRWTVSEDGLTVTFHLFENATWSDGQPVTADDVIFTFDLVMNPEYDAPVSRSYLESNVESYEALDRYTVRFHMKDKYFDAVGVTGGNWILPKHIYGDLSPEEYNTKSRTLCIGSGPWILDDWDEGNQIVLARNENYWGPKPALDKKTYRIIRNDLAGFQEFKANNVDLISPTSEQWTQNVDNDWIDVRGRDVIPIKYYTPRGGYSYIGYNLRLVKFQDKRVRHALTMLLDRQEIIDTIQEGLGRVVTGPFHFTAGQYNSEIEPIPYDPAGARRLLAEAGWQDTDGDGILDKDLDGDGVRDPFEITFLMFTGNYAERLQRYVQEKFGVAGIKVNLDSMEWSVFEDRLTTRDFEMVSLLWTSSPESDPYQIWHSSQAENRGSNYVGYKNEEVDRLIETARRELDYEKRMDMWHRVHELIHEDQPYSFLFTGPARAFLDSRFQNVRQHSYRIYTSEWYVAPGDQLR
jgi:peptide/nickel transport system substrate-binding protein